MITFHYRIFILLAMLLGSVPSMSAAEKTLPEKESLNYVIKWTGMPAGELDMKLDHVQKSGNTFLSLTLETRSNRMMSMFYKVNDSVTALIDEASFRTCQLISHVEQGHRKYIEELNFDPEAKTVSKVKKNLVDGTTEKEVVAIEGGNVIDTFSIFYRIRQLDLSTDSIEKQELKIYNRGAVYKVKFKIIERSVLYTKHYGERLCVKIKPDAQYEGVFLSSESKQMEIWLDEETGIALRMKVDIPVGWAIIELTGSDNDLLRSNTYRKRRGR